MMSRVRALIASGTSMAEAMKQVQQSMKQQIVRTLCELWPLLHG